MNKWFVMGEGFNLRSTNMMKRTYTFLLLIVLVLSTFSTAFGQDPEPLPICEGDTVTGTVVAIEEENDLIIIDVDGDGEGDCTASVSSDYDHPIVALLGAYFSDVSTEDIADALESTQVCAVQDEDTGDWATYTPAEGEECPGEVVTVTGENEDGTFTGQTSGEEGAEGEEGTPGEEIILTAGDEDTAADLTEALDTLSADWELNEDGSVADAGDDIAQYHEDGYGFGVIVKVYAIAAEYEGVCTTEEPVDDGSEPVADEPVADGEEPAAEETCGVTIEELFAMIDDGAGLGELFQVYGKPSLLGVGHVRNGGDGSSGSGDGGNGICNARANGGNANAGGKVVNCGDGATPKIKDKDKTSDGDTDGDD